jgi:hypothetical protein
MTAHEGLDDETVVLSRRALRRRAQAAATQDGPADADEHAEDLDERTVVMDRSARSADAVPDADAGEHADDLDERTVVMDRSARSADAVPAREIDDSTVVVDRTVIVDRSRTPRGPRGSDLDPLHDTVRVVRAPAPVVPQTPAIYKPRAAPRVPSAPPAVAGDIPPTRTADVPLPSVSRTSRRRSVYALAAIAAAGLVSIAGLAVLVGVVVTS